eukprot:201007-Amphidinium_carterae.1
MVVCPDPSNFPVGEVDTPQVMNCKKLPLAIICKNDFVMWEHLGLYDHYTRNLATWVERESGRLGLLRIHGISGFLKMRA